MNCVKVFVEVNSNISNTAFTIALDLADILDIRNKSGIYSTSPHTINTPIATYGKVVVSKNTNDGWIFVEFLPTDCSAIYYNFYDGYSQKAWLGWKKIPSQT